MEEIIIASIGLAGLIALSICSYLIGFLKGVRIFDSTVQNAPTSERKKTEPAEVRGEPPEKKVDPWSEGFANIMAYTGEDEGVAK